MFNEGVAIAVYLAFRSKEFTIKHKADISVHNAIHNSKVSCFVFLFDSFKLLENSTKMRTTWSENEVQKLIKLMKAHVASSGHNSRFTADKRAEIERALYRDWKAIEAKWNGLKVYHKKVYNEKMIQKTTPTWPYYDSLSFLLDDTAYLKGQGNIFKDEVII